MYTSHDYYSNDTSSVQEETKQYCPEDYAKIKNPKYARQMLEGVVVNCLREKFRRSLNEKIKLGEQCQAEVRWWWKIG